MSVSACRICTVLPECSFKAVNAIAVEAVVVTAERGDRLRLEKENGSLMAKALAAPSTALVELRGLKTEVYSLRRDKANAELREAEARRGLADLVSRVSSCTFSFLPECDSMCCSLPFPRLHSKIWSELHQCSSHAVLPTVLHNHMYVVLVMKI